MWTKLEALQRDGLISDLDLHFARFICERAQQDSPQLALGACLVSHWTGNGNVCLNLYALAKRTLFASTDAVEEGQQVGLQIPDIQSWQEGLRASGVVGRPGQYQPLILDSRGRLYLYRYWDYERRLTQDLLARTSAEIELESIDVDRLRADLAALFEDSESVPQPDWQKIAAVTALLKRFCVISGGPGTGKTTTVIRILALLIGQHSAQPPSIGLAAPTGKAAARMQEAARAAKQRLTLDPRVAAAIPEQASTIHRLLGSRPDSVYFQHDRSNPLPLDVLIVDEASMVDLALMTKLVEALPPSARLILLGDKDQLASVEAGAVLGDICGSAAGFSEPFQSRVQELIGTAIPAAKSEPRPLSDAIVLLRHSYRFAGDSGIGRLARAVNSGRGAAARRVLQDNKRKDVKWSELGNSSDFAKRLALAVTDGYGEFLRQLRADVLPQVLFAAFNEFRVLCALRRGPLGVEEINSTIERSLRNRHLLQGRQSWYAGRPIMVTRNDYNLRLFNGDIGIALPDPEHEGQLRVVFQTAEGGLRRLPTSRLPEHETVYAMTIHKSQGSEFDRVMMILPAESSRILTRELIYTGITRARSQVEIWGNDATFDAAVARRVQRSSGLRDTLWPKPQAEPDEP